MKPAFPYYGGKGRMAPWITSLIPPHRVYVEPFCGSAAVLFHKAPSAYEVVNDVDGSVIAFFKALRDHPEELQRACQLTPYAREEYAAADVREEGLDVIEQARRFFVLTTQSFNAAGISASRSSWAPSIRQGGSKGHAIRRLADRLDELAERLRAVTFESRSYEWVIPRYDVPDAVIYVDPPYLGSTRGSLLLSGGKRVRDYAHDFTSDDDHRALAEVLHACDGTVILSGYHSPLYDELYADWDLAETTVHRSTANRLGVAGARAVEVVWSNRPLSAQGRLALIDHDEDATEALAVAEED